MGQFWTKHGGPGNNKLVRVRRSFRTRTAVRPRKAARAASLEAWSQSRDRRYARRARLRYSGPGNSPRVSNRDAPVSFQIRGDLEGWWLCEKAFLDRTGPHCRGRILTRTCF